MRNRNEDRSRRPQAGLITRRAGAAFMCILLTAVCLCGCADREADGEPRAAAGTGAAETARPEQEKAEERTDHTTATGPSMAAQSVPPGEQKEAMPAEKKETVTVRADAAGRPLEITVEAELTRPARETDGEKGLLRDRTRLYAITNTEGDEEFYRVDDENILWTDSGNVLKYEGKCDEKLPVDVRVRYYLDGEEKKPEEMAGVSGDVRIRFEYTNRTSVLVEEDGREYAVSVPFTVISAILLDGDVFSEIEADNGRIMEIGDQTAVIGTAFPGLAEDLDTGSYEMTEELDIPSYVEVRAHAEDFSLDFTASVITPGLFSELKDEDLEDVEDLPEDMGKLTDASRELADAAAELYEGSSTFGSYLRKYVRAASQISEGVGAMEEGLAALNENGQQLLEGAQALNTALSGLQQGLAAMDLSSLDPADPETAAQLQAAAEAAAALSEDAGQLTETHLPAVAGQLEELSQFTEKARTYKAAVEAGIGEAEAALQELEAFDEETYVGELTETAREQAGTAVREALAEAGYSADPELEERVRSAVDLSAGSETLTQLHAKTAQRIREALAGEEITGFTVPETSIDVSALQNCLRDMEQKAEILKKFAGSMGGASQDLQGLMAGIGSMQSALDQISGGSAALTEGLAAYGEGVSALSEGAAGLKKGVREFSGAGSSLTDGYGAISEGMKAFSDGMEEFDREAIGKLGDLAGEDLSELLRRIKAVRDADRTYVNYSGLLDGQTGSVRFILETEEIGQ